MANDPDLHDDDRSGEEEPEDMGDRDAVPEHVDMENAMQKFMSCLVTGTINQYSNLESCLNDVPIPAASQSDGITVKSQ